MPSVLEEMQNRTNKLHDLAVALFVNRPRINQDGFFDYPDYGGIDKKLARKLSPDMIEHINYNIPLPTSLRAIAKMLQER